MKKDKEHAAESRPEHTHEAHAHETKSHSKEPFYLNLKFWGIALAFLFIITAMTVSSVYRLYPQTLPMATDWARNSINQQGLAQVSQQIRLAYPTLPDASVQAEAQKQWDKFTAANKPQLDQQIAAIAAQYRAQIQYTTGKTTKYNQTYPLEMDPYMYWHQSVNYADHGTVCDSNSPTDSSGECIDMKRLAPIGVPIRPNLLIYTEAYMLRLAQVFASNLDSLTVIFYLPVILLALCIIPIFFIGRRIAGNLGGFIAAVVFAAHPVIMSQTAAGFVKVTGYNLLFALLVVLFILEAFAAKKWWSRLTLAALSGISVGLYSFSWIGWWFLFFVVAMCIIALMIYYVARVIKRHNWRLKGSGYAELAAPAAILGVFFLFATLSVTLLTGFSTFTFAFTAPFSYSQNLQAPTAFAGWPNILTTVAELNVPSIPTLIDNLGGSMIVVFASFGLFVTLLDPRELDWKKTAIAVAVFIYYLVFITKATNLSSTVFLLLYALPLILAVAYIFFKDIEVDLHSAIFMMGWLLASLFASTRGIRFLLLGIPPFALGFGIALGWLFIAISTSLIKQFKRPLIVNAAVGGVILIILFNPFVSYSPLYIGDQSARQQVPGMNDGWWSTMQIINQQTPPNTIITSWWDFGHWFRALGNRSVTFDGASQNPEPGQLVGKVLLTSDESTSLGILRMLDCGQNNAYAIAHNYYETVPAKELIDKLLLLKRQDAIKELAKSGINASDQSAIIDYIHCSPPPAVFITSSDMIGKAGVWGHFGSWDFRKAVSYEYVQQLPQQEALTKMEALNYTPAQATETYYAIKSFTTQGQGNSWIAGWPGYFTSTLRSCSVTNDTAICPVYQGISNTAQGVVAIENIQFNVLDPGNATLGYGIYSSTNARLGGTIATPARVVLADMATKKLQQWNGTATDFAVGILIKKQSSGNSSSYSILVSDPLQTDSMFTKLYFLDGVFTPHFTKFIDKQATDGIIVWNVTWPAD